MPPTTEIEAIDYFLTNPELLDYLLCKGNKGEGYTLKGKIRPISRQRKCPVCGQKYTEFPRLGYICKDCKTMPNRFMIDLHWDGKRIRICSDKYGMPLDSYQRAYNIQSKINAEINEHTFDPSKYVKSEQQKFWMSNLLDEFLKVKLPNIAPSYISTYRKYVERHKNFFGFKDVRDVVKKDIIDYINHLKQETYTKQKDKPTHLSEKSIKNIINNLRTFFLWVKNDCGMIDKVPPFPTVTVSEPSFQWFTIDDQIKILEAFPEGDRPIIAFLMLHGCRPGEARALKVKHIDIKNQVITIESTFSANQIRPKRKGRGAKPVIIPIHPEMLEYFKERVKNHPEAFVFINPRTGTHYGKNVLLKLWNKVRKTLNIPSHVRLYDATRHSLASQLVNSGESIYTISKILGHTNVKTTERYLHTDIQSLRATLANRSLQDKNNIITINRQQKVVNRPSTE